MYSQQADSLNSPKVPLSAVKEKTAYYNEKSHLYNRACGGDCCDIYGDVRSFVSERYAAERGGSNGRHYFHTTAR